MSKDLKIPIFKKCDKNQYFLICLNYARLFYVRKQTFPFFYLKENLRESATDPLKRLIKQA
jgi:hypothetical protein